MKTNYQRFLDGEYCNRLDSEVLEMMVRTKRLLARFNATDIAESEIRADILRQMLGSIGKHSSIDLNFTCQCGKHIFIGGFLLLIVFNGICARAESFPLLAVCCFSIGVIRAMLVLNTTFLIAPYMLGVNTLDLFLYDPPTPEVAYQGEHMRTMLMPVLYCYILCIVQLSNYVSA